MKTFLLSLFAICYLLSPLSSFAAVEVFLDPSFREVNFGDTFLVNFRLKTDGECVNAIHAEIRYDTAVLKAVDFGTGQSLISLWTENPKIDHEKGLITFSGGIPGGYCGRVIGDPGVTNSMGKIVFTSAPSLLKGNLPKSTGVSFENMEVLLNDGQGTKADAKETGTRILISDKGDRVINEWLSEVKSDAIAPEIFTVTEANVFRDPNIQGGKYFIVWSTTDKQSGIDHFEILETNPWKFGFIKSTGQETYWTKAESPYILKDQNLRSKIMIKAVDKMGNERIVEYSPKTSLFPGIEDTWTGIIFIIALILILGGIYRKKIMRKKILPFAEKSEQENESIPPV